MAMIPFIVSKRSNEAETGIAMTEHVLVLPEPLDTNPAGFKLKAIIGVLWDDNRSPSPSYHDPAELVWITVPGITEEDGEEDEDDDGDEDEDDDEPGSSQSALT